MDKIVAKKQILILVGILVLMLVAFFMLVWKPQSERIADLGNRRTAEEAKVQTAKTTLAMLEEKKKSAASVEADLVRIKKQMPTDAELPDLINQLQDIADDAGVGLVSIKPGTLAAKGDFSELQVNLTVEGSYVSLIDFLRRVETAQRMFKTSTIDLKVKQYPDLTMSTALSAFVMGSGESSATVPAKAATTGTTISQNVTTGK